MSLSHITSVKPPELSHMSHTLFHCGTAQSLVQSAVKAKCPTCPTFLPQTCAMQLFHSVEERGWRGCETKIKSRVKSLSLLWEVGHVGQVGHHHPGAPMPVTTRTAPPIRIHRRSAAPAPTRPKEPAPKEPPPSKSKAPKPPAPAPAPQRPRPAATRVSNPQRLTKADGKRLGGVWIANDRWGSPFRTKLVGDRWFCVWNGAELGLADYRPPGWTDISCENRSEAGQLALEAFSDWITSTACSKLLNRVTKALRGFNLVCHCKQGFPCHGQVLIELVNGRKQR